MATGKAGVTTSSAPRRRKAAVRPSTATDFGPPPLKSRSNTGSAAVARAVTVTEPRTVCRGSAFG